MYTQLGCINSSGVYAVRVYMHVGCIGMWGVYAVRVYMQFGCICSSGVYAVRVYVQEIEEALAWHRENRKKKKEDRREN